MQHTNRDQCNADMTRKIPVLDCMELMHIKIRWIIRKIKTKGGVHV